VAAMRVNQELESHVLHLYAELETLKAKLQKSGTYIYIESNVSCHLIELYNVSVTSFIKVHFNITSVRSFY